MRLQRFDEHTQVPWKNGLGITREVALHAPEGAPSAFFWRISLATVSVSGPFSLFPGIDRTIAVLSGGGMCLTVDGIETPPLTKASLPYPFSGDAIVHAACLGEETTDLNVMTRRGHFEHSVAKLVCQKTFSVQIGVGTTALVFSDPVMLALPDGPVMANAGDVLLGPVVGTELQCSATAHPVTVHIVTLRATMGASGAALDF